MTRLDWQSECPGLEIIDDGLSGGASIEERGEGAVRKGRGRGGDSKEGEGKGRGQ